MGLLLHKKSVAFRRTELENGKYDGLIIPPSQLRSLLVKKLSSNRPALVIVRNPPELMVRKLDISDGRLKFLWLSEVDHPDAISPRDLYKLEFVIARDVSTRRSDVVIDGIEYLILEAGFTPTLKFLAKIRDLTLVNGSYLHLILGDTLEDRKIALIRRALGTF